MKTGVLISRGRFKFWYPCVKERPAGSGEELSIREALALAGAHHPSLFRDADVAAQFMALDAADQPTGDPEPVDLVALGLVNKG